MDSEWKSSTILRRMPACSIYYFLFHFVEIRRHKCACVHLRLLILHTNNLVNSFVLRTINEDALKDALRAVSTKLRERLLLINDLLHFLLYIYIFQ